MKQALISFLISGLFSISAFSQCYPDKHSTGAHEGWLSCETSPNPNSALGDTHWILYDLSSNYPVYDIQIWNQNHPTLRLAGVKELKVHHSQDSINWTSAGTYTIPKAPASPDYEGYMGIDLEGVDLRYLLLTPMSNYGEHCYGISEVKIFTSDQEKNALDFNLITCVSEDVFKNLKGGLEKNGVYSGPGVTDNGNDSFDFNTDEIGEGDYEISYTYQENGQTIVETGFIKVLPCYNADCQSCPECGLYDQADIDSNPIPENVYHGDEVISIGTVGSNSDVKFRGKNEINLEPGFEVQANNQFFAEIRHCNTNQVSNHSFELGDQDWHFSAYGNAIADFEIVDNAFEGDSALHIDVLQISISGTSGNVEWWTVSPRFQYFSIEAGQRYQLTFAAKADDYRTVRPRVQQTVDPKTKFVDAAVKLSPYWKTYTFEFEASETLIDEVKFHLFTGYEVGQYWLDNVRIIALED